MTTPTEEAPDLRRSVGLPAILAIGLAGAIGLVAGQQSSGFEAPSLVPRSLLVLALLSAPGVIALLGAFSSRREIVIAAGVACIAQSAISFTGVTLVFLVPGLLLLRAASGPSSPGLIRPSRVVLAVIVSIPIALVALRFLGIFAVLLLVALAGVAPALRGGVENRPRLDPLRGLVGIAVLALLVGGWVASLALTETVCWTARTDANGVVRVERTPETGTISLGSGEVGSGEVGNDEVAGGCSSGIPTVAGTVATGGFLAAALLLSAVPLPSRRHRAEVPSG